ncbi:hypothetical protein [Bradyrhizobium erythrophlei]|uniref:Uncharacterized protein n=1 Tax=Bradyrhizobium erythrophlei TaxID=1437360 RepID=A0A1M5TZ88_9BRAD|nr:hypothetical protein [Bradyrhizobium erythrophlei]SHH56008.1 hypothetical protein SAMN05444169_8075 [Bradyrhizobium erythrophlei]
MTATSAAPKAVDPSPSLNRNRTFQKKQVDDERRFRNSTNPNQGAHMTASIEAYDKAIVNRQPNFDERKTRSEFRKVIPNLMTIVVHCFDPRVTGGIRHL